MRYFVYYRINPTFNSNPDLPNFILRDRHSGETSLTNIAGQEEYVFVGTQFAIDLDTVYRNMQGEVWSPNGEAYSLIQALGLNHTSMSIGDVLIDENGNVFECDNCGWKEY